jgi:NACHT domain
VSRRVRAIGLALLGLAVILMPAIILVQAAGAHGPEQFDRWVGWSTLWALPVAAIGVILLVWDKIEIILTGPQMTVEQSANELAKVVLTKSQQTRSLLLGTDEAGDIAANVRFVRGFGRFREVGGSQHGDLASVLSYYRSLSPGRLVVLGEPGAGKTVLALELVIRLLDQRQRNEFGLVPVLISAAAWDTNLPAEKWLSKYLSQQFGMSLRSATSLVRERRILPVVDGLDEMDTLGQTRRANVVVAALNSTMSGLDRECVIVTCRDDEYRALGASVDRATHVEMVSLSGGEAADYLSDQIRDDTEYRRWQPLLAELRSRQSGLLASQLATPWRLTLAVAVFHSGSDPRELLPPPSLDPQDASAAGQYSQRINALLLDRYIFSSVKLHDPNNHHYSPSQVYAWLTALAVSLEWQSQHDMSATDIELQRWWIPTGRRVIPSLHVIIAAIPAMLLTVFAALTSSMAWLAAAGFLLAMAAVAGGNYEPARLEIRQLTTHYGRRRLAAGLTLGLVIGLSVGLAFGLVIGLTAGLALGLVFGSAFGLGVGLVVGLASGLSDPSPQLVGPIDVIHSDGVYGFTFGLLVALVVGPAVGVASRFVGGPLAGPVAGLVTGLAFGLAFALSFGAHPWVRYHIAAVVAAAKGCAPMHFGALLRWSREARLLRESGIAYQFRHRQLQDWLATRTNISSQANHNGN